MKTICLDTPNYLRWLASRFEQAGGTFERRKVAHITEALPARAVVNCTGLGARTLGGVEDDQVFPTRGQTVLVRAPWLKYCVSGPAHSATEVTYVRPRFLEGASEADVEHRSSLARAARSSWAAPASTTTGTRRHDPRRPLRSESDASSSVPSSCRPTSVPAATPTTSTSSPTAGPSASPS